MFPGFILFAATPFLPNAVPHGRHYFCRAPRWTRPGALPLQGRAAAPCPTAGCYLAHCPHREGGRPCPTCAPFFFVCVPCSTPSHGAAFHPNPIAGEGQKALCPTRPGPWIARGAGDLARCPCCRGRPVGAVPHAAWPLDCGGGAGDLARCPCCRGRPVGAVPHSTWPLDCALGRRSGAFPLLQGKAGRRCAPRCLPLLQGKAGRAVPHLTWPLGCTWGRRSGCLPLLQGKAGRAVPHLTWPLDCAGGRRPGALLSLQGKAGRRCAPRRLALLQEKAGRRCAPLDLAPGLRVEQAIWRVTVTYIQHFSRYIHT
jgi:hypothetical protein